MLFRSISGSSDPFSEYLKKQFGGVKSSIVKDVLGVDYELFNDIRTVRNTSGIQARLPFDFDVL